MSWNDPATESQIKLAADLGIEVPDGVTRGEISRLIRMAPPTEEQLKLMKKLGLTINEPATYATIRQQIIEEIDRRGAEALRNNPALKKDNVVLYEGQPFVITFASPRGSRYMVGLRPYVGGGSRKTVSAATLAEAAALTDEELEQFKQ
jgi:hypothetical protein